MEDLCPLCLNNGRKRSVKLFQVNLQEAVRMCQEDECPWPFGYKPFTFSPRIVGKIWSYYWDDHSSKPKESLSSSTKQQPLRSKTLSTDLLITPQTSSVNHFQNNSLCEEKEKEEKTLDHDFHVAPHSEPGNKEFQKNSAQPSYNSHTINNSFESIDIEKDNGDAAKELTMQKRNINASVKVPPVNESPSTQAEKFLSEGCNEATKVESSVNTTEVKIDGLPPIKLSYEIPLCPTVASNLEESPERAVSSDGKSSATRNAVAKHSLTSGKRYAKFSFCNIKKTLGTTGSMDVSNNSRGTGNNSEKVSIGQEIIVNSNEDGGKLNGSIGCSSDFSKNRCESISENSWTKTDNVNIDTVLDDFLSSNCGDEKVVVNDDWINSLLI
ncbi:uncharacterized protein LOC143216826 [Lasioglossum baleicum]|uniref:uncharacterized protein LOC143216826 n=1 Tax=Lasioglossum baleicum TaxID=434251 RepID=UPI003FCE8D03